MRWMIVTPAEDFRGITAVEVGEMSETGWAQPRVAPPRRALHQRDLQAQAPLPPEHPATVLLLQPDPPLPRADHGSGIAEHQFDIPIP